MLKAVLNVVAEDERSPLRGAPPDRVAVGDGRIHRVERPSAAESYTEILARHELVEVTADGEAAPDIEGATMSPSPAFAAHFVEVHVDSALGSPRVDQVKGKVQNTVGGIKDTIREADKESD